jgi:hypothetical protein
MYYSYMQSGPACVVRAFFTLGLEQWEYGLDRVYFSQVDLTKRISLCCKDSFIPNI